MADGFTEQRREAYAPYPLGMNGGGNDQEVTLWTAVANGIPNAVFIINNCGLVLHTNAAAKSKFKNTKTDGLAISELFEISGGATTWQKHLADCVAGKVKQFQCDGRPNASSQRFQALVFMRLIEVGGEPFILVSAQDITRFRRREDALSVMARTDDLTELHNRRHFFKLLDTELKRVKRYNNPLSLMMIDIDYFKSINDRHGHQIGDEVLRAFAATGKEVLRSIDIFARLGGEEFAVALPETDLRAARAVAERLRHAVHSHSVESSDGPINYTISIGVITSAPWSLNPDELLRRADAALYAAKDGGRNRVKAGFYPLRASSDENEADATAPSAA